MGCFQILSEGNGRIGAAQTRDWCFKFPVKLFSELRCNLGTKTGKLDRPVDQQGAACFLHRGGNGRHIEWNDSPQVDDLGFDTVGAQQFRRGESFVQCPPMRLS